jgi:hypothetical protein
VAKAALYWRLADDPWPGSRGSSAKLTIPFHLVLTRRICGAVPPKINL